MCYSVATEGVLSVDLSEKIDSLDEAYAVTTSTLTQGHVARNTFVVEAYGKCVKKGGAVYHLKSEEWALEVSQIPSQLCSVWQPILEGEYKLPIGDIKMFIVKTAKLA